MSLGARLRQYRTARNYTLDELAERMGGLVSKQALSKSSMIAPHRDPRC